ncbi:MAG: 30S ribosomal protein S17 [Patescibacteria group bacterium]
MTKDTKKVEQVRQYSGIVTSTKMDKTAVVCITRLIMHPTYKKQFKSSQKFKIHDPKNECKVGDKVVFVECRPLSKDKKWRLVKIEK